MKSRTPAPLNTECPQSPHTDKPHSIRSSDTGGDADRLNAGATTLLNEGAAGAVAGTVVLAIGEEPVVPLFGPRGLRNVVQALQDARECVLHGAVNGAGAPRLLAVHIRGRATHVVDLDAVTELNELSAVLQRTRVWAFVSGVPQALLPKTVWDAEVVAGTVLAGLVAGTPTPDEAIKLLGLPIPSAARPVSDYPKADAIRETARRTKEVARVMSVLASEVDSLGLHDTVALDLDVHAALRSVTSAGMFVDAEGWLRHAAASEAVEQELRATLHGLLQTNNLYDGDAVLDGLRRLGVHVSTPSTDALASHSGLEVVQQLLAWRSKAAFVNDGALSVQKALDRSADGRVRGTWHVHGTRTGRITSTEPNLLGLPREARRLFLAPAGRAFVYADYAASQLRILAEVTGDAPLQRIFAQGGDPHAATAASLSRAGAVVHRDKAKAINFGLPFGMKARRLVGYARTNFGVELTADEATQYVSRYQVDHPRIAVWQRNMRVHPPQEVRSIGGRIRRYPTDDKDVRSRLASQIQATEADAIKRAVASLVAELRAHDAHLVLVAYDAVLVECPEHCATEVRAIVQAHMEAGLRYYLKKVPVVVQTDVRRTWGG